jgi:hypothetical protein
VTFSHVKRDAFDFAKTGWATFWTIVSQTHLVTLSLAGTGQHLHGFTG